MSVRGDCDATAATFTAEVGAAGQQVQEEAWVCRGVGFLTIAFSFLLRAKLFLLLLRLRVSEGWGGSRFSFEGGEMSGAVWAEPGGCDKLDVAT